VSFGAGLFAVALFSACGQGDSSNGGFDFATDSGVTSHEGGSGGSSGSNSSSGGSSSGESSSGSSNGGEEDSGTVEDTGSSSSDSSSGGGTCGACTTDQECQSSCPPVSGGQGTNCCDVGSGVCYATTQSTCPTPSDASAE
jgi:hypothetical protein